MSKQTTRFNRRLERIVIPLIESADALLYTLVGLVFLSGAAGTLGYSVWSFPANVENPDLGGFPFAIITLINDLLLVMIIMEVLRTVLSYLRSVADPSGHSCSLHLSAPRAASWPSGPR